MDIKQGKVLRCRESFFFMIKKGLVEFVTMKNLFRSNFQNSNNLMVY